MFALNAQVALASKAVDGEKSGDASSSSLSSSSKTKSVSFDVNEDTRHGTGDDAVSRVADDGATNNDVSSAQGKLYGTVMQFQLIAYLSPVSHDLSIK